MGPIEALYEDGLLKPAVRLPLRAGEQVRVIVLRQPDPKRWNLERLSKLGKEEDLALSREGLAQWCEELDREDRG